MEESAGFRIADSKAVIADLMAVIADSMEGIVCRKAGRLLSPRERLNDD